MTEKMTPARVILSILLVIAVVAVGMAGFMVLKSMKKKAERTDTAAPLTGVM